MSPSMSMPSWLTSRSDGVVLSLVVQPRASKNEICGVIDNRLKLRLTSPPVEGAANKLCCSYFAKQLKIAKSNVILLSGEKSRAKRLLVVGLSPEDIVDRLSVTVS